MSSKQKLDPPLTAEHGFEWLIGTWKNSRTENTYEMWTKSKDGGVEGIGYKLEEEDKNILERIYIRKEEDAYLYISELPQESVTIQFEITHIGEFGFICENPHHDFPKKISYELNGYDTLNAELSGLGKSLFFAFKKVD